MARSLFVLGLALAGLGMLVFIFREILAAVTAGILILTGVGLCVMAIRMLWQARQARKITDNKDGEYRENVTIRKRQDWIF